MRKTKVKICGICSLDDAKYSLDLGADALGFNFYQESKRFIEPELAASILAELPIGPMYVGVFVNHKRVEIEEILNLVPLTALQFHGDKDKDFSWDGYQTIRAVRVGEQTDISKLAEFQQEVDYLLFDKFSKLEFGGTGEVIEEKLASELQKHDLFSNSFLAGGITPENVLEKVRQYRPYGIDLASGVEESPGKKSRQKLTSLFEAMSRA